MWILMAEAGGALLLFVLIVWWTMFAGRGQERTGHDSTGDDSTGHASLPQQRRPGLRENDTPER
jgi:hypothetical protein